MGESRSGDRGPSSRLYGARRVLCRVRRPNPDFDISQLQRLQNVEENAFSVRLDFKLNSNWSNLHARLPRQGRATSPKGVSGRFLTMTTSRPTRSSTFRASSASGAINEFKFGYNAAPTTSTASRRVNGIDFENISINLGGNVANTGIAGQSASTGIAIPGGLVRATARRTAGGAVRPLSVAFADRSQSRRVTTSSKVGADARFIRMTTDQRGVITTYSYPNVTAFLANQPTRHF